MSYWIESIFIQRPFMPKTKHYCFEGALPRRPGAQKYTPAVVSSVPVCTIHLVELVGVMPLIGYFLALDKETFQAGLLSTTIFNVGINS